MLRMGLTGYARAGCCQMQALSAPSAVRSRRQRVACYVVRMDDLISHGDFDQQLLCGTMATHRHLQKQNSYGLQSLGHLVPTTGRGSTPHGQPTWATCTTAHKALHVLPYYVQSSAAPYRGVPSNAPEPATPPQSGALSSAPLGGLLRCERVWTGFCQLRTRGPGDLQFTACVETSGGMVAQFWAHAPRLRQHQTCCLERT